MIAHRLPILGATLCILLPTFSGQDRLPAITADRTEAYARRR